MTTSTIAAAFAALVVALTPWCVVRIAFAVLAGAGLRALRELDDASRPWREIADTVRVASLQPRALRDYVPAAWRVMLSVVLAGGLGLFAWRFLSGLSPRQPLLPLAFAMSAAVFAWLYGRWMRELASGGDAPADGSAERFADRRREVRGVFAAELVLAVACLTAAHALLDLDWTRNAATGAAIALAGAGIGVVGCALAVASELGRRRYQTVDA